MTLDAIAKKEGIKRDTLETHYDKTQDIYVAVNYCLEIKKKAEDSKIEYNGEKEVLSKQYNYIRKVNNQWKMQK